MAYFDLDYRIDQRDNLMRCLEVHEPLASDELTLSVKLERYDLEVTAL